jgi:hypothetical protein
VIRKTLAALALLTAGAVSAQTKISDLTALGAAPATGDLVAIVDVSDTTQAASGSTKKITAANLFLFKFPASSTDNAIARYNGTDGTLQDSGITVADVSGSSVTVATTAGNSLVVETTEPAATTGASVAGTTTALRAGDAVASTDTAGAAAGGNITFTAGAAARLTSGNADAGDYIFTASAGIGTGLASQILAPANTGQTNPGYAFNGDDNTGLYLVAADNLGITVGGAVKANASTSAWIFYQQVTAGSPVVMLGFVKNSEAVTTTKTPGTTECGEQYTNAGDTDGATLTMPNDPTIGCCFRVSVTTAQTLTVVFNTGETLYMGSDQCVASMTSASVGATAEICSAVGGSGGQWHALASAGWTCND